MELFEDDFGVDDSPVDDTEITTMLLYFSTVQLEQFKDLCKAGIKKEFGQDYHQKGNLPMFLLKILNRLYGSDKTKVEETLNTKTSRSIERNLPFD